jgi:anti-sigma regulatory factor (Ser/Thr protein kinase)
MSRTHTTVEEEFPARLDALSDIRRFVEKQCHALRVPQRSCWALVLACDEICSNIIRHGYRQREGETIHLAITFDGRTCSVIIRDTAPPFNPVRVPRAELLRAPSGHGLDIANRLAQLDYRPKRGRRRENITRISVPGGEGA